MPSIGFRSLARFVVRRCRHSPSGDVTFDDAQAFPSTLEAAAALA
jgi:hypothetical protein